MLEIHNQTQLNHNSNLNFKSCAEYAKPYTDTNCRDSFDRENLEKERDGAKAQAEKDKADWDDFAEQLESSDDKVSKGLGKGARFIASAVGLAGTFVVSKYSSKLTIETLKSLAKSSTVKSAARPLKKIKEPIKKVWNAASGSVDKLMNNPHIKEKYTVLKNSKTVEHVKNIMNSEKVKSITEPLRNTIDSVRNIKINKGKIQSYTENTMAAATTGSVLVDNLSGRNDDKSTIELAAGESGEV